MTTLVVGASGATGTHLVEQLLNKGHRVKAIVRSPENLPQAWSNDERLTIIKASLLEISEEEMAQHVHDCDAIASCLGHNLNLKGMYGKPRKLVRDAIILLCNAVRKNKPEVPVKIILMNTTGNRNRDLKEPISAGQKFVVGLIRMLLPPHADNEQAAEFLRSEIGQNNRYIVWAAVRPDSLVNNEMVTKYEVVPSPTRSAIFDPGKTSRINVGHFMANLITEKDTWKKWKGQMPVIYNTEA